MVSATEARTRLVVLLEERAAALGSRLAANRIYMTDLETEIAVCRRACVAVAVLELARRRAAVTGRLQG